MPTTLICPICSVTGSVRFNGDAIEIDYDYDRWVRQCAHAGTAGMATCPSLGPIMQLMVSQVRRPGEATEDDAKN